MLQIKSQKELLIVVVSFICMSALAIPMVQANRLKEELREEKESLEEINSKLKHNLSNKSVKIDELNDNIESLNDSLNEQAEKIEQLKKDKQELDKTNEELRSDIEQKEEKIEGLTHLSLEKKKSEEKSKTLNTDKVMTMNVSAYTAGCDGCSGITYEGTNVKDTIYHPSGYRVVAVDPKVIPLGTLLEIKGEIYIADDIGGSIKGNKLDLLVKTKADAKLFGRQDIEVKILK